MKMKPLHPDDVTHLYVTCSRTPASADLSSIDLDKLHRLHGYSKVAVHYALLRNGTLVKCREPTERGATAAGHNANSLQVCLIGGGEGDVFTLSQRRALARLSKEFYLPLQFASDVPISNL